MKNQITITLAQIKKHSPLDWVWSRVLKANGGYNADLNKPFPVSSILDSNGLDDTLWVLGCLPKYNVLWRKFAWWCAAQVKDNARDDRVSRCLEVVKRYNEGLATDEELAAARSEAADAAADAAEKRAALAAKLAADAAAEAEAAAAITTAAAAALAAKAAAGPTWLARAVRAARSAQEIKLREILDSGTWRD